MLVWLAEYLVQFNTAFNVVSYITFRSIMALLTAMGIGLWIGPEVIRRLQLLKFGQEVRNDGPESHFKKRGTPTMGGVMILASIGISVFCGQIFATAMFGLCCLFYLVMGSSVLWTIIGKSNVKIQMV